MTLAAQALESRSRVHSLGTRLVFWMIVASGLLSILASAVQLYFSYQRDLLNTQEALDLFERSFHSSLSSALWTFNFSQIDVILAGLAADKDVVRIELTATTGQSFEKGTEQDDLIYQTVSLDRTDEDGNRTHLGDLRIGVTLANINARLWSQFWTLLATNMAKTTLASCAMLLLFHALVAKHLRAIATHVRGVDLEADAPVLGLARRPPAEPDDLDSVVNAINAAQVRVKQSQDATDRLNRALELANDELSRSNDELQRFAFVAAHDLQEPLRKIRAFGDLLHEEYADKLEGEGLEYVDYMVLAATRQQDLVKDLLAYSRLDAGDRRTESLDLTEIVQASLEDLATLLTESGGRVDVAALPTIIGNRSQIQQVFTNLIGNALKYRSPNRRPIVTVRPEAGSEAGAEAGSEAGSESDSDTQQSMHWRIVVEDNGIGFPQDRADDIFELFRRLHPQSAYGGTGIGLAIVKKVVLSHGGTIAAKSQLGSSSSFSITFPKSQPPNTKSR